MLRLLFLGMQICLLSVGFLLFQQLHISKNRYYFWPWQWPCYKIEDYEVFWYNSSYCLNSMCVSKSCHFLLLQNLGIMLFSVQWDRLSSPKKKFHEIGDDVDVLYWWKLKKFSNQYFSSLDDLRTWDMKVVYLFEEKTPHSILAYYWLICV